MDDAYLSLSEAHAQMHEPAPRRMKKNDNRETREVLSFRAVCRNESSSE